METISCNRRECSLIDAGLLFIRLIIGVVLIFHGSQKLFAWFGGPGIDGFAGFLEKLQVPMPKVSAVLAGSAEFFGGLCILTGFAIRLMVIPVIFTMLVGYFTAHKGMFELQKGGGEYALTLGVVSLGLGLTGAGRWSLDGLMRRKCCRAERS